MIKRFINNYLFKQRGYWFVFLLNLKAKIKNSDAIFLYDSIHKSYKIKSKKTSDSRQLIFKHQFQGGSTYINGIFERGEAMGKIYFLDEISFSPEDIVIDCGANLGDLLLWFQNRSLEIEYIAFEPSPLEFNCLKNNIFHHEAHQVALWNKDEVMRFFVSSQNADSSLIKPTKFNDIIEVKAKKLESYVTRKIKLLKLEAEGAELEVLFGLDKKIHLIEYISADLGPERGIDSQPTFLPVKEFLEEKNFSMINKNDQRFTVLFRNNINQG